MGAGRLPHRHQSGGESITPINAMISAPLNVRAKIQSDQTADESANNIPAATPQYRDRVSLSSNHLLLAKKLKQSPPHAPSDPHDTKTSPSAPTPHE